MNKHQWTYHQPQFESDLHNPDMLIHAPWAGHRNFAYDYVCNVKPSRIVELGSHYGCSAFAFLQAIKDASSQTEFYAVDTWQGDDYTRYDTTEQVYDAYKRINDSLFSNVPSHMVRKTFDEALSEFADGSIDLLHIDGSHAYEDLKHDFETWLPKVSADGLILLHDVSSDLFEGEPMGSHWYWEELKARYPYTLEFPFSNGLGLLFRSEAPYQRFRKDVDMNHYQLLLNLQDTINKDLIRRNYFTIRDLNTYNAHLQEQIANLNYHLERYRQDQEAAARYQQELLDRLAGQDAQTRQLLDSKEDYIRQLEQQITGFNSHVADKNIYIRQLEDQIGHLNGFAASKEAYIQELEAQIRQLNDFSASKDEYIHQLERQKEELNSFTLSKEDYIRQLETQALERQSFVEGKEAYIRQLETQVADQGAFLNSKESYIRELEQQKQQLADFAAGKEAYIRELEQQKQQLADFATGKEAYIRELEQQKQQLADFTAGKDAYIRELEAQKAELTDSVSQAHAREAALSAECADIRSHLHTEQETAVHLRADLDLCRADLLELVSRVEKLPFGKRLLRNLPTISSNQEDQ